MVFQRLWSKTLIERMVGFPQVLEQSPVEVPTLRACSELRRMSAGPDTKKGFREEIGGWPR